MTISMTWGQLDIEIKVFKVKGHITDEDEDVSSGRWPQFDKIGNDKADELARMGADLRPISVDDSVRIDDWGHRAWTIQRRLRAIVRFRAQDGPRHNLVNDSCMLQIVPTTWDQAIIAAGHGPIARGSLFSCRRCGLEWTKHVSQ